MGYIKEPEGVDFIIKSEPLTEEDREQISQFIQKYKRKNRVKEKKTAPNTMQRGCPSHKPSNHESERQLLQAVSLQLGRSKQTSPA